MAKSKNVMDAPAPPAIEPVKALPFWCSNECHRLTILELVDGTPLNGCLQDDGEWTNLEIMFRCPKTRKHETDEFINWAGYRDEPVFF